MNEKFGLYLILTNPVAGYEACALAAVECGVRYLQLRIKGGPTREKRPVAKKLRNITRDTQTRFIINDDLELAIESDADGIHLGQDDMHLEQARKKWNRADKLYGLSTHSMEQAGLALKTAPDYIGIGPVYSTRTKRNTAPVLGPEKVGTIAQSTAITSVAIGGITQNNLPTVLKAGITNFCVVRAVNESTDPAAAIRALQDIWKSCVF